jgi:hypothetical protein
MLSVVLAAAAEAAGERARPGALVDVLGTLLWIVYGIGIFTALAIAAALYAANCRRRAEHADD